MIKKKKHSYNSYVFCIFGGKAMIKIITEKIDELEQLSKPVADLARGQLELLKITPSKRRDFQKLLADVEFCISNQKK